MRRISSAFNNTLLTTCTSALPAQTVSLSSAAFCLFSPAFSVVVAHNTHLLLHHLTDGPTDGPGSRQQQPHHGGASCHWCFRRRCFLHCSHLVSLCPTTGAFQGDSLASGQKQPPAGALSCGLRRCCFLLWFNTSLTLPRLALSQQEPPSSRTTARFARTIAAVTDRRRTQSLTTITV